MVINQNIVDGRASIFCTRRRKNNSFSRRFALLYHMTCALDEIFMNAVESMCIASMRVTPVICLVD